LSDFLITLINLNEIQWKNYFLPGKLLGLVENLFKWGFLKIKVNEKVYFGLILLKSEKLYLRQNAQ
jgi:hypothetical protein